MDARVGAECDPQSVLLVSPLGPVSLSTDAATGRVVIEIATRAGLLPSLDFGGIAYAREASVFVRLPPPPESGAWRILERIRP